MNRPFALSAALARWPLSKLIDRLTIYLPVLLMGLLALGSYGLLSRAPEPGVPQAERAPSLQPDYFMHQFSIQQFDPDGQLRSALFGAQARHHPGTDRIDIEQGRLRSLGLDGALTSASAERIVSNRTQTEFLLQGKVQLLREGGHDASGLALPRLELRGEQLRVYTEPPRLVSAHPVSLLRGKDWLSADTLDYQGDTGLALLKGRVRAELQPP